MTKCTCTHIFPEHTALLPYWYRQQSCHEMHYCNNSITYSKSLHHHRHQPCWFSLLTRNSSGDETANVSFLRRHLQPNYAVRARSYQIWWNNAKQGPLCRSRSLKVTNFGTNGKLIHDFLLVINTNLPPILHHFQDIVFDRSKISIFSYPSCVWPLPPPPDKGVPMGWSP